MSPYLHSAKSLRSESLWQKMVTEQYFTIWHMVTGQQIKIPPSSACIWSLWRLHGQHFTKCNTGTFLRKDHSLTFDRATIRLSFRSFPFLPSSHQLPPRAHYFPALLFQKDSALVWKRLWWLQEKAEGENGPERRGSSASNSRSGASGPAAEIMVFLFSWQAAVMSSSSNR